MDLMEHIIDLNNSGYYCSQILMILLLESLGEENPGLVKALGGLSTGVGYTYGCCGCMTGGVCVLSYLTAKGEADEVKSDQFRPALDDFTKWFTEEMTADYGGIDCRDITGCDMGKSIEVCPGIMAATFEKCMEILEERGLLP